MVFRRISTNLRIMCRHLYAKTYVSFFFTAYGLHKRVALLATRNLSWV